MELAQKCRSVVEEKEVDMLQEQFTDYLLSSKVDLPPFEEENMDSFWHNVKTTTDISIIKPRVNISFKIG